MVATRDAFVVVDACQGRFRTQVQVRSIALNHRTRGRAGQAAILWFLIGDIVSRPSLRQWLHEYLDKGAIVLITGSKFYRGPPFSGAALVPASIMERLVRTPVDMPRGLRRFLSRNEVRRPAPLPTSQHYDS